MSVNFRIYGVWRDLINGESLTADYNLGATYVVGADCKYKTITSALAAAVADGNVLTNPDSQPTATVFITSGSYEEDLVLGTQAVIIRGMDFTSTVISGNHTNSGRAFFKSVGFSSTSGTCFTNTGDITIFSDCLFNMLGTSACYISSAGSSSLVDCTLLGNASGSLVSLSGDATLSCISSILTVNTESAVPAVVCGSTNSARFINTSIWSSSDTVYTVSVTAGTAFFFNSVVRNSKETATGLGCFSLTGGTTTVAETFVQTKRTAEFGAGEGAFLQNGGALEIGSCTFAGPYGDIKAAVSGAYTALPTVLT